MTKATLRQIIQTTPFKPFSLTTSSGEIMHVGHPEMVFFIPTEETIIVVRPGGGFRIIATDHINSADVANAQP